MTTVAFDGKLLAVDKAAWADSGRSWNATTKLYELGPTERQRLSLSPEDKAWIAFLADPGFVMKLREWLLAVTEDRPEPPSRSDTIGIIATSKGVAFRLTGWYTLAKLEALPFAGGEGHEVALGAMLAGASAAMSLALIARRSTYVAGGIDYVNVETSELGAIQFDLRMSEKKG